MTISPAVLDAMLAAGCTAEQIVAAVKADSDEQQVREQQQREADEAAVRLKREAAAERKRRQRSRDVTDGHAMSQGQDVTDAMSTGHPPPSLDKKSPQTPKELIPSAPASSARGGFDRFWAMFPNKVGKADALKAFAKASQRVDIETMMDGLGRYVRKTDDRPWCNPATWLNQDRWEDQPANVVPLARGSPGLTMNDFLGTVIDQQERRNAAADAEIEGYPPPARLVR